MLVTESIAKFYVKNKIQVLMLLQFSCAVETSPRQLSTSITPLSSLKHGTEDYRLQFYILSPNQEKPVTF